MLTEATTQGHALVGEANALGVLVVKRHLRTYQENQPADVQPDHEHDENGKTGIDGRVLGGTRRKFSKHQTGPLPQAAPNHRADKR